MAAYTIREECDERTGEYREMEEGEDRDPLHLPYGQVTKMSLGKNETGQVTMRCAETFQVVSVPILVWFLVQLR